MSETAVAAPEQPKGLYVLRLEETVRQLKDIVWYEAPILLDQLDDDAKEIVRSLEEAQS